jgi:hypothetical protein
MPAITTIDLPSYAVFSDGNYLPTYPAHPNPPQHLPVPTAAHNAARQYPLEAAELQVYNKYVHLHNNQRRPITVNFKMIAEVVRKIR